MTLMLSEATHVEWPLPRDTISPSALKNFELCPEQFRRKYLLRERDPSSWSSVLGTAVHTAQEVNLRQKTVTLRDMSLLEVEDVFSAAYEREIDEQGGISEIDWTRKDGLVLPSQAKDIGRPVNKLYHELVAPTIRPLATEQRVLVRVPGVVPTIIGYVDVMLLGGGKIDMKFGGSAQKQPRKDWLLQADIYNLADDTPFEWHTGSWGNDRYGPQVWTPRTAPELRYQTSQEKRVITEQLVRSYVRAIVAMYKMFGPDEPWQGSGLSHDWACNFCPFGPAKDHSCVYWPKPKPVVARPAAATLL